MAHGREAELEAADAFFLSLPEVETQEALLDVTRDAHVYQSTIDNPVAGVIIDVPVAYFDQVFDYEVPERFADLQVGSRVQVTFGNRKVQAWVVERRSTTLSAGRLKQINRVLSEVPVFDSELLAFAQAVCAQYVAPLGDVLRLIVPQRHLRAEREFLALPAGQPVQVPHDAAGLGSDDVDYLQHYPLLAQTQVQSPADCTSRVHLVHLLPAHRPVPVLAQNILWQLRNNRTVLMLAPTEAAARELVADLHRLLPDEPLTLYTSDLASDERYRTYLSVRAGRARVVIGTRMATWLPIPSLGLLVQVDDGHAAYQERRSPYCNSRDILKLRAQLTGAQYIVMNYGPSVAAVAAVSQTGGVVVEAQRHSRRELVAQVLGANNYLYESTPWARMPDSVFAVVRDGLGFGPVLVVVPHTGYVPRIACQNCGALATCSQCGGVVEIPGPNRSPQCTRCAAAVRDFHCTNCEHTRFRALRIGSQRTAQEVGRAFPGVSVIVGHEEQSAGELDAEGKLVVATPGSVPRVVGNYAAAVFLDAGYLLNAQSVEADVQFLRTVCGVFPKVRTRAQGGKILVVGNVTDELVEVAGRWEFGAWQLEVLSQRQELGLPPTNLWFEAVGTWDALKYFVAQLRERRPAQTHDDSDLPLDALLTQGVHHVVEGITLLGPREVDTGNFALLLQVRDAEPSTIFEQLRQCLRAVALRAKTSQLKLRRVERI